MHTEIALLSTKRDLLEQLEGMVVAKHNLITTVKNYDGEALTQEDLWSWAMEQVDLDLNPFGEVFEEIEEDTEEVEIEEDTEEVEEEEVDEEVEEEPKKQATPAFRLIPMLHAVKCYDCGGDLAAEEDAYEVKGRNKDYYGCTEECAVNINSKVNRVR